MVQYNFSTGPSTLPDVATLSYNKCDFSPLFETTVSGVVVKDAANRTTKFMEYTITADGYVTLPENAVTTNGVMQTLRKLLTAQAGTLVYSGRGNDIIVNQAGGGVGDVAWGPIPELLEFQPLGAGRSAKVKWAVKVRIPEAQAANNGHLGPVLQFNEETSVGYDDAGFSSLTIRGTLEVPLTRPTQGTRTLTQTADDFRQSFMDQVATSIDLTRFRVTRREFQLSRDKRTLEWSFAAEELPYMGMPAGITKANGMYDVKPVKAGPGLVLWLCSLNVTYTVPNGQPRRLAYLSFLALMRKRMFQARFAVAPVATTQNAPAQNAAEILATATFTAQGGQAAAANYIRRTQGVLRDERVRGTNAILIDFQVSEGLYLDSKTTRFSATWRITANFTSLMQGSGLWVCVASDGGDEWAMSMRNISGGQSWLDNRFNASQDVIVDFGGGG